MPGSVPVVTRVAASTAEQTLIAANPNRKGLIVYNHSGEDLFIKFGTGCVIAPGSESFTEKIPQNWQGRIQWGENYVGVISCRWGDEDAGGCALVTELTG